MKPIADYIRENLEQFDSEGPPKGHFDRFEARLAQLDKKENKRVRILFLKVAAAIFLGMAISYITISEFSFFNRNTQHFISSAMSPELNQAERYYNIQLEVYSSKIQDLKFNNDKIEKRKIIKELSDMDEQVQAMKKDLRQNPDDERIVYAIINFYQLKIELMDMIIARTQQSTNTIL
jgi:hypothetical protein